MELLWKNEELIEIILEMTLPKTEQEWLEDLRRLVQFKKLKGTSMRSHQTLQDSMSGTQE
jgi:hypothetical protein